MILIFESWCTIEVGQSIVILCIVTWDPVYQDTDIILVTCFYEILKFFWCAIGMLKSKVTHKLVTPTHPKRMSHEWHEFHVGIVHLNQIWNQLFFQFFESIRLTILF